MNLLAVLTRVQHILHNFSSYKIKLHNLFEHNTDYLMFCPTGVLLLHALQQHVLQVLRREVWLMGLQVWIQFHGALRVQCAHYSL